ncbi:MAG TPA: PHP domain-containing protein [Acidimicrobiales bacterium]|nr:PHP domain-containing protein [Acidimicrobiales bacterium]
MIDLHTHSTCSDGSDTPARVAELAAAAGCSAFALTDHDRLDGQDEAGRRAAELGVRLVPGCEISCEWDGGTFHLLVYFVPAGAGSPLEEELVDLQQARDDRNGVMIERLRGLGLPITYEEVLEEAAGAGVGRPHVAAVLVRNGAANSIQDAFDRWLAKGKPGYVDKRRLHPDEAMAVARASGGLPVMAHPLSLGLAPPELAKTVGELADLGLTGMECWYGRYTPEERAGLAALAVEHGLVATGGSDHHGTYKPDLTVGRGRGDLDVPDSALAELEGRLR